MLLDTRDLWIICKLHLEWFNMIKELVNNKELKTKPSAKLPQLQCTWYLPRIYNYDMDEEEGF